MKKYTFTSVLVAAMLALVPASETLATENISKSKLDEASANSSVGISFKETGSDEDHVYLKVQLKNESAARFRVTDKDGVLLFSKRIAAGQNTVVLRFSPEELATVKLMLSTEDGVVKKVFHVNEASVVAANELEF